MNFILEAEIWAHLVVFEGVKSGFKNFRFLGHISALKIKFKNRLGESESIHMKGLSPKNEPICPRRLGCRGGCSDIRGFSPCNSLTSVILDLLREGYS